MLNLIHLLGAIDFRSMSKLDHEAFSGASDNALIGYCENATFIIEKDEIHVIDEDGDETVYKIVKE